MNSKEPRSLIHAIIISCLGLQVLKPVLADTFRVEIDYMGQAPDGHDHMPAQIVLDAVVEMFACHGHTLILDLDDQVPHYATLIGDPTTNCGSFFSYTGAVNTYRSIRNTYRDQGAGWHYCIFAHDYSLGGTPPQPPGCYVTGSSGLANGGDAFIVTLGSFSGQTGSLADQAATLAHELGHNLGLSHCGTCPGTGDPFHLNLASIMTYQYQLAGVRTGMLVLGLTVEEGLFKEIDFSDGRGCSLNENNLDEIRGTLMKSVDFNCDDDTIDANVIQDLNFAGYGVGGSAPWCGQADVDLATLSDFNEWNNLNDGAALVGRAEAGDLIAERKLSSREARIERCITKEAWDHVARTLGLENTERGLVIEPCLEGHNHYIDGFSLEFPVGTCAKPWLNFDSAFGLPGSTYFAAPGTYDVVNPLVLDRKGIYMCNTGVATIH